MIVAQRRPGLPGQPLCAPVRDGGAQALAERIADHATIDRIVRMGGGFRMGPFELADLVGIDVGFEVSKSFWEQSFHEPRWRPSMIQARMVQAGRFGRKAGRGYYDYRGDAYRGDDPEPPPAGGGSGASRSRATAGLRTTCASCRGRRLRRALHRRVRGRRAPRLLVDAAVGRSPLEAAPDPTTRTRSCCVLCVDGSLAELDAARRRRRLPRPATARGLAAGRADAVARDASTTNAMRAERSSGPSASTSSGSATRRALCSGGSSASS